jgi:glutamate 5-kinase
MAQVIIFTNERGGVSICYPTGELPIEVVLERDCPAGAVIIDSSALPQDQDQFFDAWRLVNGAVTVDQDAVNAILERQKAGLK